MPLYTIPQVRILSASASAVSGSADTNENILATINLAAGIMGPNGIVRISHRWTVTASANAKTARIRFGGIGGTSYQATAFGASDVTLNYLTIIQNRNSQSSQIGTVGGQGGGGYGLSTGAFATGAIDTSAATTIVITGQKASAGETMTLESYIAELIVP